MKLIAYETTRGGGMLGGYSSTSVTYTDDGRCKVDISGKTYHSEPIKHEVYYADGLLEKLSEVCKRYNVVTWTDIAGEKTGMLDEASSNDNFIFEDGTKIVIESGRIYPGYVHEMYCDFNQLIKESKDYGVDYKVTEEAPMMMGMMAAQMEGLFKVQYAGSQNKEVSKWAKFCVNCGAEFTGDQKFCAECGSMRQKL